MRKSILTFGIILMMLALATPVWAKDKGPGNAGNGKAKQTPATAVLEDGTPAPETGDEAPAKGPHGNQDKKQEKQQGNPHGDRQNFLLFGTIETIGDGKITVTVCSGNHLVQAYQCQAIEIEVNETTAIRMKGPNVNGKITFADLAVGQTVRVHGWMIPAPESTDVAEEPTTTPVPATWVARQITVDASQANQTESTVER